MKTVMDFWCEFRGIHGGTIHQCMYEFKHSLTDKERDKFCGKLVDNLSVISDKHHVQDLMKIRLDVSGIVFGDIK